MTSVFVFITILVVLFAAGYRSRLTEDAGTKLPDLPDDLDAYLEEQESTPATVVPGAEKEIIWAGTKGERTEYALVYLHGFSATRREISPVVENLAGDIRANAFFTRLSAHGEGDPDAFARVRADDWATDVREAVEIGKRIGDKVILVGTSTGATLATWWYTRYPDGIYGMILVSPNFGIKNRASGLFLLPWGRWIARLVVGTYMTWDSENDEASAFWSNRFRSESLAEMMACVRAALSADLHRIDCPLLVLYTNNDETLNTEIIRSTFTRFGSSAKEIHQLDEATRHVLAGDILSPHMTAPVTGIMKDFLDQRVFDRTD